MTQFSRFPSAAAIAAALSMAATPAMAAEFTRAAPYPAASEPGPAFGTWNSDSVNTGDYRRHWRHDDGIDAGDVIAGVLVLGTIAAIASAASKPKAPRTYPADYPDTRAPYQSGRDGDYRGSSSDNGSQGLNRAADMCVNTIERDVRVDGVDAVQRSGDGWQVTGSLYNGDPFSCEIGNDGQIKDISYGRGRSAPMSANDRQWSDQRYAQARNSVSGAEPVPTVPGTQAAPAYPGGPVAGEPGYLAPDDGRYNTSKSPDFTG